MYSRYLLLIVIVLLGGLVVTGRALTVDSSNYRLDWFTPLTGGGGGPMQSPHYAVNMTVGQTALGQVSSTNYAVGLGYWYGVDGYYRILLPVVVRNYS
jgi:hypothetical protein